MPQVLVRPRASADLAEIWDHIAKESPARADVFLRKLGSALRRLGDFPSIGRPRYELLPGLRSVAAGGYAIYYQAGAADIEIIRILHGARDIPILFR